MSNISCCPAARKSEPVFRRAGRSYPYVPTGCIPAERLSCIWQPLFYHKGTQRTVENPTGFSTFYHKARREESQEYDFAVIRYQTGSSPANLSHKPHECIHQPLSLGGQSAESGQNILILLPHQIIQRHLKYIGQLQQNTDGNQFHFVFINPHLAYAYPEFIGQLPLGHAGLFAQVFYNQHRTAPSGPKCE